MSYLTLQRGMELTGSIEDYPEGIVVVVDKPYRWTSADVIRKVKWMAIKHFHKKNLKVGHAGTLDPLATGVLLVCIGKATKLAETFQKARKQYIAGVTFGATTASYDLEKEVDGFCDLGGVSEEALRGVLPSFVGEQDQVAPLFSAKSVDGVRVYEIARKRYKAGLPVDELDVLQASRINIYDLSLQSYRGGVPSGRRATLGNVRGRGPAARLGGMSGGAANRIGGSTFPLREVLSRPVSEWRELLTNDFERSVFPLHPEIARLKNDFYAKGATYAAMSGSGSAVFALFPLNS